VTRVELFELIRRDHLVHQKSIREIARTHGVHRRVVRQALRDAVPPNRAYTHRDAPVLTPAIRGIIEQWLIADRTAPRKQRHTARRIYQRLRREHRFTGAESTVRRYVGARRRELGLRRAVFVPQDHCPGHEAEVDYYEGYVDFPSGRTKVYILAVRACFSGREFHIAASRPTQQAFLEGIALALEWFGGVFHTMRFDNLSLAVRKVLRGRRRLETDRFIALRSHYLFKSDFCTPGIEGAHEKGGVEGGLGRFRRNHLVPVPVVDDFEALNQLLRTHCAQDDLRCMEERDTPILTQWALELPHLLDLPATRFDTAEVATYRVDNKARVKVRTNRYSVPVRLAGRKVEVRLFAQRLVVTHTGLRVAKHPRLQGRHGERLVLDHYLELLTQKPGALPGARPLAQARRRGEWPDDYDRLWKRLNDRYDSAEGARQLLEVLFLHREHATETVHRAVAMALELGCTDAGAIAVLVRQLTTTECLVEPLDDLGGLAGYGSAASDDLSAYNALLGRGGVA